MKTYNHVAFITTPLQAAYFIQIYDGTPEDCHVVFTPLAKSAKSNYYARKLTSLGFDVRYGRFEVDLSGTKRIYAASLDRPDIKDVLANCDCELYSFDDGTINIATKHAFRTLIDTSRIARHYTMFRSDKNIISDDRLIYKPFQVDTPEKRGTGDIHIYLSQPIPGFDAKGFVQTIPVTHYVPHPRLGYQDLDLALLDSPKIFEEHVVDLLGDYENVYVYSFCSTSAYLLKNIPGLHFVNLDKHGVLHRRLGLEKA